MAWQRKADLCGRPISRTSSPASTQPWPRSVGDHYRELLDAAEARIAELEAERDRLAEGRRFGGEGVMYLIRGYCHRTDDCLAAHSFQIDLSSAIPELVAKSGIDQTMINQLIKSHARYWLDACGYDAPFEYEGKVQPLYDERCIRVRWGAWGPEHIDVPGNACGLDISERSFGCAFAGGRVLLPHNLDGPTQKYLLTIVFCEIMESIVIMGYGK